MPSPMLFWNWLKIDEQNGDDGNNGAERSSPPAPLEYFVQCQQNSRGCTFSKIIFSVIISFVTDVNQPLRVHDDFAEPWYTKYKFKINATATQRNMARIISTVARRQHRRRHDRCNNHDLLKISHQRVVWTESPEDARAGKGKISDQTLDVGRQNKARKCFARPM